MKKTILTVEKYLKNRDSKTYNKQLRILESGSHKNCGDWLENKNKEVKAVKITSKYLFIFI